jgi:hypothetical protein
LDSNFVRSIQNSRQKTAGFAGLAGEDEGWKRIIPGFLKLEFPDFGEAERLQVCRNPIRPGDGVLDRETHIGVTQLGEDRTIHELDHRMNDALWMNHHLHMIYWHVEQPSRLDHFEAFVE